MAKTRKGGKRTKLTGGRRRRRRRRTRRVRRRRRRTRGRRGGNVISGVVSAIKTALPTIVLYEALRAQGKRTSRKRRGGTKSLHRKRR